MKISFFTSLEDAKPYVDKFSSRCMCFVKFSEQAFLVGDRVRIAMSGLKFFDLEVVCRTWVDSAHQDFPKFENLKSFRAALLFYTVEYRGDLRYLAEATGVPVDDLRHWIIEDSATPSIHVQREVVDMIQALTYGVGLRVQLHYDKDRFNSVQEWDEYFKRHSAG